ncbi:MAG TPA: succinate dehydrogenase cytochrome b subunit [Mycobacteriales bacterium]|nr:succinate dehydrogenase cytochrome b subunit [Mycobacteriales bacterium]
MVSTRSTAPRLSALWHSSIGKKIAMAATGLIMLAYLLVHMLGNLKIFFGRADFDHYAAWLRTIGTPALRHGWFLWVVRVILVVAVVIHAVAAYQLSRRDQRARPVKYASRRPAEVTFATRTMRWGGAILALFVIWHVLDLTVGATNPDFQHGEVYGNVVADFTHWWPNVIYIVAMLALGLHIHHGFWSAAQTLGITDPVRDRVIKIAGSTLAVVISGGFVIVPIAVMTGITR